MNSINELNKQIQIDSFNLEKLIQESKNYNYESYLDNNQSKDKEILKLIEDVSENLHRNYKINDSYMYNNYNTYEEFLKSTHNRKRNVNSINDIITKFNNSNNEHENGIIMFEDNFVITNNIDKNIDNTDDIINDASNDINNDTGNNNNAVNDNDAGNDIEIAIENDNIEYENVKANHIKNDNGSGHDIENLNIEPNRNLNNNNNSKHNTKDKEAITIIEDKIYNKTISYNEIFNLDTEKPKWKRKKIEKYVYKLTYHK